MMQELYLTEQFYKNLKNESIRQQEDYNLIQERVKAIEKEQSKRRKLEERNFRIMEKFGAMM